MPNTILLKRGTTVPTATDLQAGEIAINTLTGFAYTKTSGGAVVQIGSTVDLSAYALLSGATFSGAINAPTIGNLLNQDLVIDSYNDDGAGTHYLHKFTPSDGKFVLAPNGGGLTFPDGTVQTTAANISNYVSKDGSVMNIGADIIFNHSANQIKVGDGAIEILSNTNPERVTLLENRLEVSNGTNTTKIAPNGIIFSDGTFQSTSATAVDLSGYAQLSGATFKRVTVDDDNSQITPFSIVGTDLDGSNIGIWGNRNGMIIGTNHNDSQVGGNCRISGDGVSLRNLESGQFAGFFIGSAGTSYLTPYMRLTESDGTQATNSTEVRQGRIFYNGVELYAPIASPAFTGVPTAPTPSPADNSTTIATTAYVTSAVASATTSASTDKVVKTCRNATGSLIPARSVVYINGANGTHPTIQLARANAESTSYRTFGITSANIANSADGTVVIIGEILNVNTGSFSEGDQLYLSPTIAGGITNVKPSAPDHLVYVGVCTRANTNNGSIEVKVINGFEINELHDVAINGKLNKDLLSYEQSTNLWKNKSAATLGIAELSDPRINALTTNFIAQSAKSTSTVSLTYYDGFIQQDVTTELIISSPSGIYDGWTVTLSESLGAGSISIIGNAVTLGCAASNMQDALGVLASGGGSGGHGWTVVGGGSPYVTSSVLQLSTTVNAETVSPYTDSSVRFLLREGLFPELARLAKIAGVTNSVLRVDGNGVVGYVNTYVDQSQLSSQLSSYALKSGVTFTGKVNLTASTGVAGLNLGVGGTATASTIAGDIWLPTSSTILQYRDATGVQRNLAGQNLTNTFSSPQIIQTANASPALRVTQTGTGHSLVVEDSTNPDTNSFIVNANGAVAIGRDPATWTPSTGVGLDVAGKGVFTTTATSAGINIGQTNFNPSSPVDGDIWMGSSQLVFRTGGVNNTAAIRNSQNTFAANQTIQAETTLPLLRLTQTGTGPAILVEDSANPDVTSFVIDGSGNVGIGVASGYTPVGKLDVDGSITSTTAPIKTSSSVVATTEFVKNAVVPRVTAMNISGPFPASTPLDWNTIFLISGAGYGETYIELPSDSENSVIIGTQIVFVQYQSYPLNFANRSGVTIMSSGDKRKTTGQGAVATAIKIDSSTWLIAGDLGI
jgi:hypothetical protein